MARFSPVGPARELATTALAHVSTAIGEGRTGDAADLLEQVVPESPDQSVATVAGCTSVALGLLDDWLSGHDPAAPTGLTARTRIPAGHWIGERASTDVLALATKGRAFRSLDTLTIRQGGHHLLYGSAPSRSPPLPSSGPDRPTPTSPISPPPLSADRYDPPPPALVGALRRSLESA